MAEDLGQAVLELSTDNAPLYKGLDSGEARTKQAVDVMQRLIDSVTHKWVEVGMAAKAAGDIEVHEADRVTEALMREAAAARLAGDEITAARAKGAVPTAGATAGAPGSRVIPSGGMSGIWGVRGPAHPGSLTNPLVVVLEAAKYAPMGSMGAAIGSSNMADQQGNNSPVASALDLAALSDQVGELARSMDSATRLAQAGQQGLANPGMPQGGPSTVVQDPEGTLLLEQAVQTLRQMQEGIAKHPAVEKTQSGRVLARALVPDQSGSVAEALARQAAADAVAGQARRDYARTIRPGSGATAEQQTAALAQREAAVQEANAARAQSKAAQAEIAAATAGGAGGGGGPRIALGAGGGGSGGRDIGKLLGTIFRGNGGKGGHFGLPSFGSIGSLAGLGLEHWLLTGLGVGASATSAVGGAGLLGAAGLTQSLVGGGSDMLISHDVVSQAQQMYTNVQALNKAIAVYGKGSNQARAAQYDLNQQWKELGGGVGKKAIENLDKGALAVKKLFDTTSTGARLEAAAIDEQVLGLAKTYTPLVTAAAQRNLGIINTGLKPLFSWLEGPQGIGIFHQLENAFARDLPTAVHAFDMGAEDFLRLMASASQYTGGLAHWLDKLFTAKNRESAAQYNAEVGKLVGDLRLWEGLLKLLGEDLAGVFKADQGTAPAIVTSLTQMLQKLHDWEQSTQGQHSLENIFEVHKQEILELLHLLPELGSGFGSFYLTVAPPLVLALTGIAKGLGAVLGAVEKLGPAATDLVGLTIVLGKLGLLAPALRAFGGALGFDTAAEVENTPAAITDAAATRALAASQAGLGVSGARGAAGEAAASAEMSSGEMLGLLGVGSLGPKAALGDAAKVALPGLLAGGAGLLTAGMLQQALGLKGGTGSTVGSGLVGGGIGFAVGGPLGAAIGAGVAGTLGPSVLHLLGSIFSSGEGEDYGKKFAQGWVTPFQGIVSTKVGQTMQKVVADAVDKINAAAAPTAAGARGTARVAATPQEIEHTQFQQGQRIAEQFVKGLKSIPDASTGGLLLAFTKSLGEMPARAGAVGRAAAAAKQMLSYAQQLVHSGALPRDAISKLLASLEAEFPELTHYLSRWGLGTQHQLATAFDLTHGRAEVSSALTDIRSQFKGASEVIAKTITAQNLFPNLQSAMAFLHNHIASSTGKSRDDAVAALTDLTQKSGHLFGSMLQNVQAKTGAMKDAVSTNSNDAFQIGSAAFEGLATNIASYVGSGAEATGKGLQNIDDQVNAALKQFGEKGLSAVQIRAATPGQLAALVSGTVSAGALANPGHATGAKVSTPMYMVGEEAPAHPEYVLATNPAYRSRNLGLWASAAKDLGVPGFAAGGVIGEVDQFFSAHGFDRTAIAGILGNAMQESSLDPSTPGGGMWQQISNFGSGTGGTLLQQMTVMLGQIMGLRAQLNAAASPGDAAVIFEEGFERAGIPAMANRIRFAQEAFAGTLSPGSGALGGAVVPTINVPGVAGMGAMSAVVRGLLGIDAKAAGRFLQSKAPAVGGGGGMPGTILAPPGSKPAQIDAAMMAAAHQILGLPYTWGGGHTGFFGDPGFDCSGAVSYLLHAAGLLSSPEATGGLESWGEAGPGKYVTVGVLPGAAHDAHTMISFFGHFLESGGHTSAGPHWDPTWSQYFPVMRHPPGLAHGGIAGDFGQVDPEVLLRGAPQLATMPEFRSYATRHGFALPPLTDANTGQPIPASFLTNTKKLSKPGHKPKGLGYQDAMKGPDYAYAPDKLVNGIMGKILGLDGLSGGASDIGNLNELMAYKEGLWGLDALNYSSAPSDFVVTQDALGNPVAPYIDQKSLNEALRELMQILGWQGRIVHDLKTALALSQRVVPIIKRAIKKRQDEIEKTKALIRSNVAAINGTTAQITAEKKKKHPDKKQLGAWNAYRSQLEADNMKLGGSRTTLGSGGYLGNLQNEVGTLKTNLTSAESWPFSIAGGTGLGGDLGPAILAYDTTEQQIDALKPGAGTALSSAQAQYTPATSSTDSQLLSLVEQQLAQQVETNTVLQDQYGALAAMPEFGGSFALGGMVPGPVGAARTVIAHGGEVITPVGGGQEVHTHVYVDRKSDLHKLIDVRIEKSGRATARKVGRKMPGRAGLLVVG